MKTNHIQRKHRHINIPMPRLNDDIIVVLHVKYDKRFYIGRGSINRAGQSTARVNQPHGSTNSTGQPTAWVNQQHVSTNSTGQLTAIKYPLFIQTM